MGLKAGLEAEGSETFLPVPRFQSPILGLPARSLVIMLTAPSRLTFVDDKLLLAAERFLYL
jgi:hypothetical protein